MHIFTTAAPNHGLPDWGPITNYALAHTGMAAVISDLICGGVCARYPDLKFVPTEWETGWVAHFLQRLDWALHRSPSAAAPEVTERPSEYFHRNFIVTFEDDRTGILTRNEIGVRNLMWGSDYPHHDSIFPRSQEVLTRSLTACRRRTATASRRRTAASCTTCRSSTKDFRAGLSPSASPGPANGARSTCVGSLREEHRHAVLRA